ncbi:MAG: CvpA family protein [Desulfotomaculaceae bacterium]|nr:CvpA family protein [Desulfotomaculaceae bacterium]
MNWLDWLIVAVLVISAFQGLRRGLLLSVAKLAGVLLGFGLGITYYRELAAYLNNQWQLEEKVLPLAGKILEIFFPAELKGGSAFYAGSAAQINPYSMLHSYGEYLASSFTATIINAICFLALVILTVWVVNLAGLILNKIADLSFLGPLNHVGGLFFGGVKGIIIVMIVLTLISPFQHTGLPRNSPQMPGGTPSNKGGVFSDSKMLPYFVPLFNAIDRPLLDFPLNMDRENPVKSI